MRARTTSLSAGLTLLGLVGIALSACGRPAEQQGGVPEKAVRHNLIGTSLLSQQRWDDAKEEFRKALEIRPDDPIPLTNLAVALLQQGQEQEAEGYLRSALEADAGNPYAHYNLGLIEKNRGNPEPAVEHFRAVAETDPEDVFTLYNLAAELARLGRVDEAEAHYRAALVTNPTHISTLYGLGRLLLQKGEQEEGSKLIRLSQEIRARSGLDAAVGTQYGEQGPYALGVDYPGGGLVAPEPIPVKFRPAAAAEIEPYAAAFEASLSPSAGVAALTVGDLNGDGVVERVELRPPADGAKKSAWTLELVPFGDSGSGRSQQDLPLSHDGKVLAASLLAVDRDHDGDLDLFGCLCGPSQSACFLADNDGSGQLRLPDYDTGVGLPPVPRGPVRLALSDFDNDRDVDLIAAEPGGLHLFSNLRDGTFADVSEEAGARAAGGGGAVSVADFNKDGWPDLVVSSESGPAIAPNDRGRFGSPRPLGAATSPATRTDGLAPATTVLDFDNDGFLDVAAAIDGRLRIFRNEGQEQWREVTAEVLEAPLEGVADLTALDLDDDGDVDLSLLVDGVEEGTTVLWNEGGNANNWTKVEAQGVADNKFGIGTKIEVLAGALRQKFEVTRPVPIHAGLGARENVDAVRFLWPGGVLQDELAIAANETAEIDQLDRKGTSCPLLYAWRNGEWKFVTDFLGGCAIGYRHDRDSLSTPDTDEYVKIEGGLTVEGGTVRLRLNNQLEEVIWFDQAELVVVDHPEGTQVFPNEALMPGPPWPEFGLFASGDVRPVRSAREVESGRDVTDRLLALDRRYADGFERLPFKGYAELHTLELDLGELPDGKRIVLLLDGWIDYADSSANIAASQAGAKLVPPRLYVADGRGDFELATDRMGFPAGLPKTMTVDLTRLLPPGDGRIRIATTMRIYWDRVQVMVGGEETPLRVARLSPASADLRFGGFPAETSEDGKPPFGYDPKRVARSSPWKAHAGAYTAFGGVTDLVVTVDDRFVTTRAGDELELRFRAPAPVRPGWTRTWLLYADGFGKDMDPNSAASSEIGPIPFHGMPVYPYGPQVAPPNYGGSFAGRRVVGNGEGLPGAVPLPLRAFRDR